MTELQFPLEDEAREFWDACGGRGFRRAKWPKTREAYLEARKHASRDEIFAGLRAFKQAHEDTPWRYLPHSTTWLRDMQWMDFAGVEVEAKQLSRDEQAAMLKEIQERVKLKAVNNT